MRRREEVEVYTGLTRHTLHVNLKINAARATVDRIDSCFRYYFRLSGTAAALHQLGHHLLVQPDVHLRRTVERASIAEFLRDRRT
jgi:hypothetical protein